MMAETELSSTSASSTPPAGGKAGDASKVLGQCGYCGKIILIKEKILPLECKKCKGLFHVRCLRGPKPPVFLGDNLYWFTCGPCGSLGRESWERPHLQWVYVTHLALYNLIMNGRGGRRGFYRWNEDICGFIRSNWNVLMPHRKKTQSWHSTVAGTLSVHCPTTFKSGYSLFGEHGWWTLTSTVPPSLKAALWTALNRKQFPGLMGGPSPESGASSPPAKKLKTMSPLMHAMDMPSIPPPPPRQRLGSGKTSVASYSCDDVAGSSPHRPCRVSPDQNSDRSQGTAGLVLMTEHQEKVLLDYLDQCLLSRRRNPKANRLLRKLKVRARQRMYEKKPFDLDESTHRLLFSTVKYVVDKKLPYYDQVIPQLNPGVSDSSYLNPQARAVLEARLSVVTPPEVEVLEQLSLIPVLSRALPPQYKTFRQLLCGGDPVGLVQSEIFTSPYTARKLKPFIFRSSEIIPPKVAINREITLRLYPSTSNSDTIDFCYFQEHHLAAVNNMVSHFFWPVDLSECLQYPDFTCVVLFKKLLVGCAFMTPDVKVNEAYISFLAVHPDFQGCGIGKIMLYHLIQSCMGKDITLHVSVDNPAMILYQTMGFKTECYCLGFYNDYYPEGHYLSKNAYYMRLCK